MSTGTRLPWEDAVKYAEEISRALKPVVVRSKVVGSVRRRRPTVGDIEFLVEPRMIDADLFGNKKAHVEPIRALCESWGIVEKGGERMIQVKSLFGMGDVTLDLYMVHPPANWWCLLAIRTGPRELGEQAVTLMQRNGLYHRDGRIVDRFGEEHPVESEQDFFQAASLRWLPPHLRDDPAARRPTGRQR